MQRDGVRLNRNKRRRVKGVVSDLNSATEANAHFQERARPTTAQSPLTSRRAVERKIQLRRACVADENVT